jgi:hypothetical protein
MDMPIRLLNAILLIATLIGGVLAYRAGTKRQQLLTERTRLEKKVGSMPIDDQSKVHVRALETGDELHFAWRVYLPAGFNIRWRYSDQGSSWSTSQSAREFIARVRLREDKRGIVYVFIKQCGGSSRSALGDGQVADLLRDRWDEVRVEQLAAEDVVVVDADEVATLLRLTLSDDLKREAEQKLNKYFAKRFETALLDVRFGSDQAFQQAAADNGNNQ